MTPEELLIKISKTLNDLQIPYAVTGGFALVVWSKPRYTADIDVIIDLSEKNIKPLVKKILEIDKNIYADEEMVKNALVHKGEFNVIYPETGIKIDFFVQDSHNLYNQLKIKRAIIKNIFGQKIPFVSPEDLIISKLIWAKESDSYKQTQDIRNVLSNKELKLDLKYIKNWAGKHGMIEMLNNIVAGKIYPIN